TAHTTSCPEPATTPTTRPTRSSSSVNSSTPAPAGAPSATPSWPTQPPPRPANTHAPAAKNSLISTHQRPAIDRSLPNQRLDREELIVPTTATTAERRALYRVPEAMRLLSISR